MTQTDTITAVATPPGRGGIAVVRVSGPMVAEIMQAVLGKTIKPRQAVYTPFYDDHQEVLDEGLALFFPNPNSFTGEDVLELQGHGGPVIVDALVKRIIQCGARLARPGEFSERAFLNDKLDLAQAEAIADLIDAQSETAARLAMRSLQGEFSRAIHALNEKIIHLRMYVEAAIDFTDEEIDFLADDKISAALKTIITTLNSIQAQAAQGSLLREGMTIVIAGEPNVGKSSLLNALSGKELAIVTDIPGTTRDVLRDHILLDGIPVHIIDTAGLRTSDDVVELEGIKRAKKEIESADMIFYLLDSSRHHDLSVHDELIEHADVKNMLFIRNKIDLLNEEPGLSEHDDKTIISISAKQQLGIDFLKTYVKSLVGYHDNTESVFLARRRHLDALDRANAFLTQAEKSLLDKAGELAAEDLRLAHDALCEITGEFSSDDLLGRIFSSFCIGK